MLQCYSVIKENTFCLYECILNCSLYFLQAILEWLREELSIRVHKVSDVEELDRDWLSDSNSEKSSSDNNSLSSSDVKVLLFTHLIHPPLFLAALSIKFTGNYYNPCKNNWIMFHKFIKISNDYEKGKVLFKRLKSRKALVFIIM